MKRPEMSRRRDTEHALAIAELRADLERLAAGRLINPPAPAPAFPPAPDLSPGAVNKSLAAWMDIAEVAAVLGLSPQWTIVLVRRGSIPGGEMMYRYERRRGERWHVDRETFNRWRESMVAAGIGDTDKDGKR